MPTIDAYLLQLPQFQPGTGGFTNVSSGCLGDGRATLNLRGLGSVRTQTLLDGRRLQPGNAQSTIDINTIPLLRALRRRSRDRWSFGHLWVGCGGGCREFQAPQNLFGRGGLQQLGQSERGDATTHQVSAIAGTGFADGAGSVVFAAEFAASANRSASGIAISRRPRETLAALLWEWLLRAGWSRT